MQRMGPEGYSTCTDTRPARDEELRGKHRRNMPGGMPISVLYIMTSKLISDTEGDFAPIAISRRHRARRQKGLGISNPQDKTPSVTSRVSERMSCLERSRSRRHDEGYAESETLIF